MKNEPLLIGFIFTESGELFNRVHAPERAFILHHAYESRDVKTILQQEVVQTMRSFQDKANPEKRYQAGVIREAKIHSLLNSTKQQNSYLATAKWEVALGMRDVTSQKKWDDEKLKNEARMTNSLVKNFRRSQLEKLYRADDISYEEELNSLGLAKRIERP